MSTMAPMEVTGSTSDAVTIRLTGSEALVLSDALSRMEQRDSLSTIHHDDPATRLVLNELIASFEPVIDEAFNADYNDRVEVARRDVLGG